MPRSTETLWPNQPFPTNPPPFARQRFTVDDLNPYLDKEERARYRDYVLGARNERLFTPPGPEETVQMPGNSGGSNWGGAAIDPHRGMLYVVSKDHPSMLKLVADPEQQIPPPEEPELRGRYLYDVHCHRCHSIDARKHPIATLPLDGVHEKLPTRQILKIIREGLGPMPGFPSLSVAILNLLTTYLQNPSVV